MVVCVKNKSYALYQIFGEIRINLYYRFLPSLRAPVEMTWVRG